VGEVKATASKRNVRIEKELSQEEQATTLEKKRSNYLVCVKKVKSREQQQRRMEMTLDICKKGSKGIAVGLEELGDLTLNLAG